MQIQYIPAMSGDSDESGQDLEGPSQGLAPTPGNGGAARISRVPPVEVREPSEPPG